MSEQLSGRDLDRAITEALGYQVDTRKWNNGRILEEADHFINYERGTTG